MDDRSRNYLRERFGDYYRANAVDLPPAANEREWGHIPWTPGTGTTMVRHQSQLDLGDVDDFLARTAPRHAYFSAARYADPSASTMSQKGWRGADLVFDLDADHLPSVDPEEATYAEMLATCKDALLRLLRFIQEDFAFEDVEIVFSGGRGYHVHVRDSAIQELDSDARREIVDYVLAEALDIDGLIRTVSPGATNRRMLKTEGGWGQRVHKEMLNIVEELKEMSDAEAATRLKEIDGIGEKSADTILTALEKNPDAIQTGNMEAGGPGIRKFVKEVATQVITGESAPIDEPVTTDTHRLIRLPKTLHGGSGLVVKPLDRAELAEFDPLEDAIPERFRGQEIEVELDEPQRVELDGDITKLEAGHHTVAEYVGVFLMTRGEARKV